MKTSLIYDKNYYECGIESGKSLYTNYRWMPELTIPMCSRMIEHLKITSRDNILDFGCAKGYSVKAFRLLGREAWGFDTSEYALSCGPTEVKDFLSSDRGRYYDFEFDWVIAKDVLEHVPLDQMDDVLSWLRKKGKKVFIVVPLGDGEKYEVPSYELDKTHVIRECKDWWINKLEEFGFEDIKFSYLMDGIKENWSQYEKGNGFLIAK